MMPDFPISVILIHFRHLNPSQFVSKDKMAMVQTWHFIHFGQFPAFECWPLWPQRLNWPRCPIWPFHSFWPISSNWILQLSQNVPIGHDARFGHFSHFVPSRVFRCCTLGQIVQIGYHAKFIYFNHIWPISSIHMLANFARMYTLANTPDLAISVILSHFRHLYAFQISLNA